MNDLNEIISYINSEFRTNEFEMFSSEVGITHDAKKPINKIGYCTNLTLEVIDKAKKQEIDLIITHHDAWDFIYGLKEKALEKLKEYKISHYYSHLPLDDCEFGTNSSLLKELELNELSKHCNEQGFMCGALGEYENPISFNELCDKLKIITNEPSMNWKFNDRKIKRVFVVCGAGFITNFMKEAIDLNCDVYITGEKILYTIQYAKMQDINLIIGSHTFTELFGVESMVAKIIDKFNNLEMELLEEEHLEMQPFIDS